MWLLAPVLFVTQWTSWHGAILQIFGDQKICDPDQRVYVVQQRVLRNRKISAGDKLPRNIESAPWLANKLINVLKKYFDEIHHDFDWVF